jgi:hypothetical protein
VTERGDEAGDPAAEPKDGEGAHTGHASAGLLVLQLPAALDPDQQTAGERRRDT